MNPLIPTLSGAQQALAEASRRLDEAGARLGQAERGGASAREQDAATIEVRLAIGRRDKAERDLRMAKTVAEHGELDAQCEAFATMIERDYPPPANTILAAMATSFRLQGMVAKARGREVFEWGGLTSPDFCGSLRLLALDRRGFNYAWYPAPAAEIRKIDAADLIPLDECRDGDVAAANAASRKITAAYVDAAGRIAALLMQEADLEATLQRWSRAGQTILPQSPTWRISSPMERLGGGGLRLCTATVLPAVGRRDEPIWTPSMVRGHAGGSLMAGFQ